MIRMVRRVDTPRWLRVVVPLASALAALIAGSVLLLITGNAPISVFSRIASRGFGSATAWSATIEAARPLLFTGLAAAVAFRMGVFNIGAEGQMYFGTIAAAWVGLRFGSLGAAVIPLMILGGAAAGAAWAAIPGFLRARFNASEVLVSLMLNYVAGSFMNHLIFNSFSYWRLTEGTAKQFPQGKVLDESTWWPYSHVGPVNLPFGFLLGLVLAVGLYVLYRRTRFGFEVDIIGDSPRAAEYAGMRTRRKIVSIMALSGAAAGLAGASDIGDSRHALDPKGLGGVGYGYSGIVVAALAKFNPLAVVLTSIIIGGLDNAGRSLQGPDFPAGLVGVLKGLLLFFALGGEVFARYRIERVRRPVEAPPAAVPPAAVPATAEVAVEVAVEPAS
jgi:simple sugar transport system permease protein